MQLLCDVFILCALIIEHSLAVTYRIAGGAVRAQSKLILTLKIECSCVYDVQWIFIQFHPERRRSIKRYLHCFFSSPAVENNICNGKSGSPFQDFTLLHYRANVVCRSFARDNLVQIYYFIWSCKNYLAL